MYNEHILPSRHCNISVKLTHKDAKLPVYTTPGAAGADVHAVFSDKTYTVIGIGEHRLIQTGLSVEIPEGYEIQVRSRSGLAMKNGVIVLNSPGTVDSDYRGELGVILMNLGNASFMISTGDRIAQIVVAPVVQGIFTEAGHLSETERGAGGFGSTGVGSV